LTFARHGWGAIDFWPLNVSPASGAPALGPSFRRTSMTRTSRRLAGVLLVLLPSVVFGGASILWMLVDNPEYRANALRQDLWRAGHAHAGVWLILALVVLRYVDEARLSEGGRWFVRLAAPIGAILTPLAFFASVLPPDAREPNNLIYLAYGGGAILALGVLTLGVGLLRSQEP
jgi:hypothetical protein